jgi:hypothetical protein
MGKRRATIYRERNLERLARAFVGEIRSLRRHSRAYHSVIDDEGIHYTGLSVRNDDRNIRILVYGTDEKPVTPEQERALYPTLGHYVACDGVDPEKIGQNSAGKPGSLNTDNFSGVIGAVEDLRRRQSEKRRRAA